MQLQSQAIAALVAYAYLLTSLINKRPEELERASAPLRQTAVGGPLRIVALNFSLKTIPTNSDGLSNS